MKVNLEFDTKKPAMFSKVSHDGEEKTDIQNLVIVMDANDQGIPAYLTNVPGNLLDIIKKGIKASE